MSPLIEIESKITAQAEAQEAHEAKWHSPADIVTERERQASYELLQKLTEPEIAQVEYVFVSNEIAKVSRHIFDSYYAGEKPENQALKSGYLMCDVFSKKGLPPIEFTVVPSDNPQQVSLIFRFIEPSSSTD